MGALTTTVIALARAHQQAAYALILLVAFSEALPIVGAFVPGDAVIFGVSALVPTGALNLWPAIGAAALGAVFGDGFSYWVGRRYREPIVSRWPFNRLAGTVARGEEFLGRHGGKSVFIARFTPGVRAIVPWLAGILQMGAVRFYSMNVLSALVWAPAHILAGAAIGASFVLLGAMAGRLALIVALLIVLLGLLIWAARQVVRHVPRLAAGGLESLRRWAEAQHSWLGGQILSVLDPARKELPGLVLLGAIVVVSLWLFLGVLQDVIAGDPLVRANEAVFHFLQALRTDWVDQAMVAITELGDAVVIAAVFFAALLWLVARRNWRAAGHVVASVAIAVLSMLLLKLALHVAPIDGLHVRAHELALPSGHTAASASLYGFLAIVAAWELSARWRAVLVSMVALLIGAIAFSRIYLGVHWLSDVLAGTAFGMAWGAFLGIAYLRHQPPPVGATGLCASVALALMVVGAVNVDQRHAADMSRYAVHEQRTIVPWDAWWRYDWSRLPARRVDLVGGVEAPLTFQWAGPLRALRRQLVARHWVTPVPWTFRSTLSWLAPHVVLAKLPVLPHLQDGHREAMVMIHVRARRDQRVRWVMRLWRSSLSVKGLGEQLEPVYIGTVTEQRAHRLAAIVTVTPELMNFDHPRDVLGTAVSIHRFARRLHVAPEAAWDGRVLLGRFTPVLQAYDDRRSMSP